MSTYPEWFQRDVAFFEERLESLGIEVSEYFEACDILGLSPALMRKYLIAGSAIDLQSIIDHARALRNSIINPSFFRTE